MLMYYGVSQFKGCQDYKPRENKNFARNVPHQRR